MLHFVRSPCRRPVVKIEPSWNDAAIRRYNAICVLFLDQIYLGTTSRLYCTEKETVHTHCTDWHGHSAFSFQPIDLRHITQVCQKHLKWNESGKNDFQWIDCRKKKGRYKKLFVFFVKSEIQRPPPLQPLPAVRMLQFCLARKFWNGQPPIPPFGKKFSVSYDNPLHRVGVFYNKTLLK